MVARRGFSRKKTNIKLKKNTLDFKQKKETRPKRISTSQLAIRNFSDLTEKEMNKPCVFFLGGFPYAKPFLLHICTKETPFPVNVKKTNK